MIDICLCFLTVLSAVSSSIRSNWKTECNNYCYEDSNDHGSLECDDDVEKDRRPVLDLGPSRGRDLKTRYNRDVE